MICHRIKVARRNHKRINKVLIIDVHQGDGTASMLSNDHDFLFFLCIAIAIFPLKKMTSDIDVSLKKGTNDQEYLDILGDNLEKLDHIQRDIVFFQAGVDIFRG